MYQRVTVALQTNVAFQTPPPALQIQQAPPKPTLFVNHPPGSIRPVGITDFSPPSSSQSSDCESDEVTNKSATCRVSFKSLVGTQEGHYPLGELMHIMDQICQPTTLPPQLLVNMFRVPTYTLITAFFDQYRHLRSLPNAIWSTSDMPEHPAHIITPLHPHTSSLATHTGVPV